MTTASLFLLLAVEGLLISALWFPLGARSRRVSPAQGQVLHGLGFLFLLGLPLLPLLPDVVQLPGRAIPGGPVAGWGVLEVLPRLWLAGCLFLLIRGLRARRVLRTLLRSARVSEDLEARCRRILPSLPLGLRILVIDHGLAPCVAGVVRPVLLLPSKAMGWGDSELAGVLLHEVAHLQRRDPLLRFLAEAACVLHWFNPLVWKLARRFERASEEACDASVLEGGVAPADYARSLLTLALSGREAASGLSRPSLPALAMAAGSEGQLEERVRLILREPEVEARPSARSLFVAAALILLAVGCGNAIEVGDPDLEGEAELRLLADPFPATSANAR